MEAFNGSEILTQIQPCLGNEYPCNSYTNKLMRYLNFFFLFFLQVSVVIYVAVLENIYSILFMPRKLAYNNIPGECCIASSHEK